MSYNNIFLRTNSNVPSLNSNESDLTDTYLSFDGNNGMIKTEILPVHAVPKKTMKGKTVQPRVCCFTLSGPSVPRVTFIATPSQS